MKQKRPNILLLFSDQHNADILGCAGNNIINTPNLDRIASNGVMYNRAYCQNGICMPSRISMLTGQYCRTIGQYDNSIPLENPHKHPSFVKMLHENGYETAAFGKRHLDPCLDNDWDHAMSHIDQDVRLDGYYSEWVKEQGQYNEHVLNLNAESGKNKSAPLCCRITKLKPKNTMSAFTAEKTIDFIKTNKSSEKPFLCWASFFHPHQPYTPLQEYVDMYDIDKMHLPESLHEDIGHFSKFIREMRSNTRNPWCMGLAEKNEFLWRKYVQYYYALVTEIDHHIGRIIKTLKDEGVYENTIIIYSSDHGEFLGAHGLAEKMSWGHNIYEDTLRVPLIFSWENHIRKNVKSNELVELIDIYPTLMNFCEIINTNKNNLPGISLTDNLLNGGAVGRKYAVSENLIQLTAIGDRYKLGIGLKPEETGIIDQVYDKENDPYECNNIVGCEEVKDIEKEMKEFLDGWILKTHAKEYKCNSQGTRLRAPGYFKTDKKE